MPIGWVAAAGLAAGVIGGVASNSAANKQADSASAAQASQERMFNTINDQQAPWRQAGSNALSAIQNGFGFGPNPGSDPAGTSFTLPPGLGGGTFQTTGSSGSVGGVGFNQFNHQFNASDLKTNLAPNYDFMLNQGLGAVNNSASLTGGLVGGNALKGINDYAQNYASNGYQQAYNNYNTNQTNIFNRLSSIAGLGQTSNGQTATAGTTLAGNIGSAQMAGGAAAAAGIVGSSNALTSGLNNAAGWYLSGTPTSSTAPTSAPNFSGINT